MHIPIPEKTAVLTIDALTDHLGKDATVLLEAEPFRNWRYERALEMDLGEPLTDYAFPDNGMDFVCDRAGTINTIFLYNDSSRRFAEAPPDLPLTARRPDVLAHFGTPTKSGEGFEDDVLGTFGAWDRFDTVERSVHVEYAPHSETVRRITLMRGGTAP